MNSNNKSYKEMEKESMTVCIEFRCNSECVTCMLDGIMHNLDPISFEEFKKIIDENKITNTFNRLILSGAEVTMNPDLENYIKYAKKNGGFKYIQLQTNGRKFSDVKYCEKIINAGVDELFIPILGHESLKHDYLTQRKGSFDETILGIKNISSYQNTEVMINTIMTSESYMDLPKIVELVSKYKNVKSINFWNYWPMSKNDDKNLIESIINIRPFLINAIEQSIKYDITPIVKKFPACLLNEHYTCVVNCLSKTIIDEKYWEKYEDNGWKCIFSNECKSAESEDGCSGLPTAYINKFGWEEELLKPIQNDEKFAKYLNHIENFNIKKTNLLKDFEDLLTRSKNGRLECSCKIQGCEIYPVRFNIWYEDRKHNQNLKLIREFIKNIELKYNLSFDYKYLKQIITKDFDFSKVHQIIVGTDFRAKISDSRLKIWFIINDYKSKVEKIIGLTNLEINLGQSRMSKEFLFGIDLRFDGKTNLKVYPFYSNEELLIPEANNELQEIFSGEIFQKIKKCKTVHISFLKGGNKILHFQPYDKSEFVEDIKHDITNIIFNNIKEEYEDGWIFSLEEKELDNQKIKNINLYY